MLTRLRRVLSRKASVAAMIEAALWLAIPYILVGIVWTFVNADEVDRIESRLETKLPAGSDLVAFGATTALWPLLLITPEACAG
jgi:hypothetical protein